MASAPSPAHASEDPPWTWCGDPRGPDFGAVFASPGAAGAVVLSFDRAGRHHALTLFASTPLGKEVVVYGRRFAVVVGSATQEAR
jgi:hypothetical protein